jgi:hypothetical protein
MEQPSYTYYSYTKDNVNPHCLYSSLVRPAKINFVVNYSCLCVSHPLVHTVLVGFVLRPGTVFPRLLTTLSSLILSVGVFGRFDGPYSRLLKTNEWSPSVTHLTCIHLKGEWLPLGIFAVQYSCSSDFHIGHSQLGQLRGRYPLAISMTIRHSSNTDVGTLNIGVCLIKFPSTLATSNEVDRCYGEALFLKFSW